MYIPGASCPYHAYPSFRERFDAVKDAVRVSLIYTIPAAAKHLSVTSSRRNPRVLSPA